MAKTPSSQCRGSRLDCWPGNQTPHAATEDAACYREGQGAVCCWEGPGQPNEDFQKLSLCLVCLGHPGAIYQPSVLHST